MKAAVWWWWQTEWNGCLLGFSAILFVCPNVQYKRRRDGMACSFTQTDWSLPHQTKWNQFIREIVYSIKCGWTVGPARLNWAKSFCSASEMDGLRAGCGIVCVIISMKRNEGWWWTVSNWLIRAHPLWRRSDEQKTVCFPNRRPWIDENLMNFVKIEYN